MEAQARIVPSNRSTTSSRHSITSSSDGTRCYAETMARHDKKPALLSILPQQSTAANAESNRDNVEQTTPAKGDKRSKVDRLSKGVHTMTIRARRFGARIVGKRL